MKIGILGAGQLGMMLAQAGQKIGMEFRFMDPASEIAARGLGEHVCAAYEDIDALEQFARGLDFITFEFENVRMESVRWLAQRVPTAPSAECLRVAGDRQFEKDLFAACGIPTAPYATFFFRDEYDEGLRRIGYPAVLKTRRFGYDGKGQRVIRTPEQAEAAWKELNGLPLFLEGFVDFDREVSLVSARDAKGNTLHYPLVENHHRDGILRLTYAPAPALSPDLQALAEEYARRVMEKMNYVGVLAIEFFQAGRQLMANEMAPRVHNSGHWSIEGAVTSQFENHLRAVAGLPLEPTKAMDFSAMINLIGEIPDLGEVAKEPDTYLHDYGKKPRAGRKVGHITVLAETRGALDRRIYKIADRLKDPRFDDVMAGLKTHGGW